MRLFAHHPSARALVLSVAVLALTAAPASARAVLDTQVDVTSRAPQERSTDMGYDWGALALGGGSAVGIFVLGSIGLAASGRRRLPTAR